MSDLENIDDERVVPDGESEDFEAILGNDNSAAFRRYAVPPQFEGNSSDDEEHSREEEAETKETIDAGLDQYDEPNEDLGYAPLVADEFGDFVSSENFGDYFSPDNIVPLRELVVTEAGRVEMKSEESSTETSTGRAPTQNENVRICIPPLDASKNQILT